MNTDWQTKTLISCDAIEARTAELARELAADYVDSQPLLVGVLNAAAQFLMALVRHWPASSQSAIDYDFVDVSSYDGMHSSGQVRLVKDVQLSLEGRDVILVEGIVDTGRTLRYLLDHFSVRKPASLSVCALLDKRNSRRFDVPVDYCGFEVDDLFVVGFGLDFNQSYRALDHIAVLEKRIKEPT